MRPPVVLVLRALGLGDGLAGVAALRGVRRMSPGAWLVLAAPAGIGGFLLRRGVVDEVLDTAEMDALTPELWASRAGGGVGQPPEVAVDLHGRGPASHRLLQALHPGRLIAWHCPAAGYLDGPDHRLDEQEVDRWCRLVTTAGGPCSPGDLLVDPADLPPPVVTGRYAVLHPGAASGARRWPARRFAEVGAALAADGWQVVVTGAAAERVLTRSVTPAGGTDLAGTLDLDTLASVVAHAGLVVCGDTGVAHLATAYRTPSVLLFGPTPPRWWGPAVDGGLHRVLWHGPELAGGLGGDGQLYRGDPHAADVDPALARITPAEVLVAARDLTRAPLRSGRARSSPGGSTAHGVGIPPFTDSVSPLT